MRISGALATLGLTLLACALLLASAACGDGDDNGDDPTATAPLATELDGETPSAGETPSEGETPGGAATTGPATTSSETGITAVLTNTPFSITLSDNTVPAGRIAITVSNQGTVGHNFWVIRTNLPAADLPVTNNVVDVGSLDVVVNSGIITNDEDIEPGDALEITLPDLTAGSYVVICNVPDHYSAGMRASLAAQ